jgi:hypothetical protein
MAKSVAHAPAEQEQRRLRPVAAALRAPALAAPLVVAAFLAVSVGVRLWLAWQVPTPWIMSDELSYSEMAKSFAATGHFLIRGYPSGISSVGYPFLISAGWLFGPVATAYGVAKAINVVLMSLSAVPVYLWTSRLVRNCWWAVVAAALALLVPGLVYSGMLMTENAFLPSFVLATFAIALALERPTLVRQGAALAAIGLVCVFRIQGLVLLVVLPVALVAKLLLDLRAEPRLRGVRPVLGRLRPFWPTGAVVVGSVIVYVAYKLAQGVSLTSGFGTYTTVATAHYSVRDTARWALYHFAELPLAFGVVPACAFLLLLLLAIWRGAVSEAERAFLATATAALALVVVQVAAFASRFSFRVEERYMFVLAPLFIVALAVWLDRGLPRPPLPAIVAAAVPVMLFATLPLRSLLNVSILSDTFGLIPFLRQADTHGFGFARGLLIGGGAAAGILFLVVPRRLALLVPVAVAVAMSLWTHSVEGAVRDHSRNLSHAGGMTGNPSWIDAVVGRNSDVAYLYGTSNDLFAEAAILWQVEFWNRSLKHVYNLGTPEPTGFAATMLAPDANGHLVPPSGSASSPYVVAADGYDLAATVVASHPPFVLYRVGRELRLTSSVQGIYGDGWTSASASYTRFTGADAPARRGMITVTLSRAAWAGPDVPGHVRIVVRSLKPRGQAAPPTTLVIHSRQTRVLSLGTPAPPFRVELTVSPTFSPSQFGGADTRQLGVQTSFFFRPRRP